MPAKFFLRGSDEYTPAYASLPIAVTIAEPESTSPPLQPTLTSQESSHNPNSQSYRQHRAGGAKRLSGRPAYKGSTSSLNSVNSVAPSDVSDNIAPEEAPKEQGSHRHHGHHHHHRHHDPSRLLSQIMDWLHEEKRKRSRKSGSKGPAKTDIGSTSSSGSSQDHESHVAFQQDLQRLSDSSDRGLALEKLEQILAEHMVIDPERAPLSRKEFKSPHLSRRHSSRKLTRKNTAGFSSDTEYLDGDAIVPSADVVLDNSKTMGYTGGAAESTTDLTSSSKRAAKEREGWLIFKSEIVRLAHTLRLKGWRRVPLDRGDIHVERLSGALTNAVYVVSPPNDLPPAQAEGTSSSASTAPKLPPPKLLLRVYGPQVEHLIDRESELQILRRLARKKIGPRLLGTFINGRFEEFFNARTLTARDLRIPETSKQIAKRMRELHDGIDLLESERDTGPFVWRNWDKWVKRCEEVINWVDHQIVSGEAGPPKSRMEKWKKRGLICGVEWSVFRNTVERYRKWLDSQYGGPAHLKEQLVFAHNDTQYGNLLRIEPSGESPLLLPANEHKQLVVIDFEYASANVRGLEFANHF
ncbi:hypothetical protein MMC30_008731, partial [Trapelia coarctata]|nr:hypothetical protein [Trapelia coarctata]